MPSPGAMKPPTGSVAPDSAILGRPVPISSRQPGLPIQCGNGAKYFLIQFHVEPVVVRLPCV
eukprot:1375771-Heterocapsa_arctica.AAC.1